MVKHEKECDCYECSDPYIKHLNQKYLKADKVHFTGRMDYFDEQTYLNKFVRSNKEVKIYRNPGEAPISTRKPNAYIGRTVGFNKKKNWIKLSDGNWIVFDKSYTYKTPDNTASMSDTDKIDIAANIMASNPLAPPASVSKAVISATKGVAETGDAIFDFIGSVGKNLKWIVIAIIVLIVIYFSINIYNKSKSL